MEKDMRLIDRNATLDWTLERKKWRGLLVAAQVLKGLLSCWRRRRHIHYYVQHRIRYTVAHNNVVSVRKRLQSFLGGRGGRRGAIIRPSGRGRRSKGVNNRLRTYFWCLGTCRRRSERTGCPSTRADNDCSTSSSPWSLSRIWRTLPWWWPRFSRNECRPRSNTGTSPVAPTFPWDYVYNNNFFFYHYFSTYYRDCWCIQNI